MPRARSLFRREMTGSRLQMILDEKSIYDKELKTTGVSKWSRGLGATQWLLQFVASRL
ncbi:hypothetical protein FOQG_19639 [Fusarium oxysporum f. sp. raphani 54005]|uniref:Uncharacterized protein n=2 Tax=Fusarium oxysporum TaxID=5507 RepID=X0BAR8_FUSOX|nr:hypothetical protein FOQG_19639 [Fusarium oxysporum f. sp. raphani 54005]